MCHTQTLFGWLPTIVTIVYYMSIFWFTYGMDDIDEEEEELASKMDEELVFEML
jgi:hypothetical protein